MNEFNSESSNFGEKETNSEKFSSGKVYSNPQTDDNNYNNNNNNNSTQSRTNTLLSENMNLFFVNYGSAFCTQKKL